MALINSLPASTNILEQSGKNIDGTPRFVINKVWLAWFNSLSASTFTPPVSSGILVYNTSTSATTSVLLASPSTGLTISNATGVAGNPTITLDADLDGLAALSSTGLLARTGTATYSARTLASTSAGLMITNGDGVAAAPSFALSTQLQALSDLGTSGLIARTGAGTVAGRTITGTSNEITVTDGDGVNGNPTLALASTVDLRGHTVQVKDSTLTIGDDGDSTKLLAFQCSGITTGTTRTLTIPDASGTIALTSNLSSYQPLDSTLTALAAYSTNGLLTQTAADTFTGRTITGTSNEISVSNGDGVSGNPTLSLASTLDLTGKTVTLQDNNLTIQDNSDTSKKLAFELSGITTATTRTLTIPDASGVIALTATTQPLDATLTALAAYNTNGVLCQTAADTFAGRTITGTSNKISVTNGDGVSGNPTLTLPTTVDLSSNTALLIPTSTSTVASTAGAIAIDTNTDNSIITQGSLEYYDGTRLMYVAGFDTLPTTDDHVLAYDGTAKKLVWQAQSGGGGGTPGGSDTQVQFNDSSAFGGDAGFTYNKTTDVATITGGLVVGGNSTASGYVDFKEDSDNGSNKVRIIAPSSVASDKTATLRDATGTVALTAGSTGIICESSNAFTARTLTAGIGISVTNGDGSGGNPTVSINAPALNIGSSTTQSIANGSPVKVTTAFGASPSVDNLSCWSTVNTRYTPNVAGIYCFVGWVRYTASYVAGKSIFGWIYKNGSNAGGAASTQVVTGGEGNLITPPIFISMNGSTDYIELYTQNGDTTTRTLQTAQISGWLVAV